MTIIGYARVSTKDQKIDMQIDALRAKGCSKIFIDHGESGSKRSRAEWDKCRDALMSGDKLVVYKLDRVGRSIRNLLEIIDDLTTRKIEFESVSNNIDTTTSAGKLMFNIMASFAEYEREILRERVLDGLEAAKRRGQKLGSPSKYTETDAEMLRYYIEEEKMKITEAAALCGISRASAYRIVKDYYESKKAR